MSKPLMPKATAVWLIDNTALTFDQIADYCGLHPLEVKGIADGDVAHHVNTYCRLPSPKKARVTRPCHAVRIARTPSPGCFATTLNCQTP